MPTRRRRESRSRQRPENHDPDRPPKQPESLEQNEHQIEDVIDGLVASCWTNVIHSMPAKIANIAPRIRRARPHSAVGELRAPSRLRRRPEADADAFRACFALHDLDHAVISTSEDRNATARQTAVCLDDGLRSERPPAGRPAQGAGVRGIHHRAGRRRSRSQGRCPADIIDGVAELGLLGCERDFVAYVAGLVEISKAWASLGAIIAVHNSLVCYPIARFGSDAQKQKYLPLLTKQKQLGCYAFAEPAAGSDAGAIRTTAVADGDAFVLNGHKRSSPTAARRVSPSCTRSPIPPKAATGFRRSSSRRTRRDLLVGETRTTCSDSARQKPSSSCSTIAACRKRTCSED